MSEESTKLSLGDIGGSGLGCFQGKGGVKEGPSLQIQLPGFIRRRPFGGDLHVRCRFAQTYESRKQETI